MHTRSRTSQSKENTQVTDGCPSVCNDDVSCSGSRISMSRRSSGSTSKATLVLAKLEEQQLIRRLEMENQLKLQEARDKVQLAELQVALSEGEEEDWEPVKEKRVEKEKTIRRFLDDCGKANKLELENDASKFNMSGVRLELPKVELSYFSGNECDYWKFIRQFEFFVEGKVEDPAQRLLFLLNYCKGKARLAIDECIMLPPKEAYIRAREILKDLFGQTHTVATSLIKGLTELPVIRALDHEALTFMSMKMSNCQIALKQMDYTSDIDALHTLEMLVMKLPLELRDKWSREVDSLYKMEREPRFDDLTRFISDEARISRSRFGRLARSRVLNVEQPVSGSSRYKSVHNTINITSETPGRRSYPAQCLICHKPHKVKVCPRYLGMSVAERWESLKRARACFVCLESGHRADACPVQHLCSEEGCQRSHHPSLHIRKEPDEERGEDALKHCAATSRGDDGVYLGVLPVLLRGPMGTIVTYALLDNGSDTTLIKKEIVEQLGLECHPTEIRVRTVTSTSVIDSAKCSADICQLDGEEVIKASEMYAMNEFPVMIKGLSAMRVARNWPHLADIKFPVAEPGEVGLLIGCDIPEAHWALDQRIGGRGQPFAVKTMLGWMLLGPSKTRNDVTVRCTMTKDTPVWGYLQAMYNQEFGDIHDSNMTLSQDEKRAVEIVRERTRYVDGHFEVPLPWRPAIKMHNNYEYAWQRLMGLRKRFQRQNGLFEKYNEIIQQHLTKNYVVRVERELIYREDVVVWYLPHHPVLNPKKPDKVRIVFDCAAKYKGKSLNDCLYQGPDTTANLSGILLRFRRFQVALAGDIEEMFLQVKVPDRDREALRFLWWAGPDTNEEPIHYRLAVHPFGATSSPFCANFALSKAATEFGADMNDEFKRVMKEDIYVDDCITSVESVETAIHLMRSIVDVCRRAGFRLRKWMSNNRKVIESVPDTELADPRMKLKDRALPTERTLGLEWNADKDMFKFQFDCRTKTVTRRSILACVSSLFDPLGMISPFILPAKILLQELCRSGMGWDEPLRKDDCSRWEEWIGTMRKIGTVPIPRCVIPYEARSGGLQLHIFCDASEVGYGSVAYVRTTLARGRHESRILMAKSRVAPIKTVTVPRLELTAAVLGVRLMKIVQREMNLAFDQVYLWTDSVIVLRYIANTKSRFCTFVANRLQEIHETTIVKQWRHVESKQNPADLASRGLIMNDRDLSLWLNGPSFLGEDADSWPVSERLDDEDDSSLELKKGVVNHLVTQETNGIGMLLSYYSNWLKLLRAVVWITRFKTYILLMKGRGSRLRIGEPSVDEMMNAELDVIKYVQKIWFEKEYEALARNEPFGNKSLWKRSSLRRLYPFLENGVLHMKGRSEESVSLKRIHPMILPKDHPITVALIRHYHEQEGHSGVSHVLASIRQKYWIIQGGAAVKRVIGKCFTCRKLNATTATQMMAPLPMGRMEEGWHPFKYVGVDYFGPLLVKRGRVEEKRYGCLFTCLQCRAIHIEVAQSLTTDSFMMALMRFISRRGKPSEIYSDNGSNFVGAEMEMRREIQNWSDSRIERTMVDHGIKWHFNPPSASHRGGVWERMIRSVRRILNSSLGMQTISDEMLLSFLCEAERIVNDRPLTQLRDGADELEPLRPIDLLHPNGENMVSIELDLQKLSITRYKTVKYLTSVFWRRWLREYIPTLQTRQRWFTPQRNLSVGDLVLVVSELLPKGRWPLGIVERVEKGNDQLVRTVTVRTANSVMTRDVRKVCLLEGID